MQPALILPQAAPAPIQILAVGTTPRDADPITLLQCQLAGMAVRGIALFDSERIRRDTIVAALNFRIRPTEDAPWLVRDLARDLDWLAQEGSEDD
jgi:hypothetical protein